MIGAHRRALAIAGGFAVALAAAGLVYDPRAEAADPKRLAGLVLAAAAFAWMIVRRGPRPRVGWGARAGIAFVALSAASLVWGLPCGARDLGTLVGAVGVGAAAAQMGRRLAREVARASAVTLGGLAGAATIASALAGARGLALHAGQGNPNWLGLLLAVASPLIVDAAYGWTGHRRAAAMGAFMATTAGLVLSHSRVGWLAAFVGCAWTVVAHVRARWTRPALVAVAACALVACATPARGAAAAAGDVPADLALRGRAWIWHESARAATAGAPFGVGLGRFAHAYLTAQGEELARRTPPDAARHFVNATTAHEEFLQAAVESGPLAALLLVWALLLGARAHARAGWVGGAASLAAVAVACMGDSPLRQPAVALLAGVVLGVPTASRPVHAETRTRALAPALIGLALVAWLLAPATRTWLGARARSAAAELLPNARLAALVRAARLDPGSGEAALEVGLARLAAGDAAGALDDLRRADELLADTGARIAMGSALLARGDGVGAAAAYRRALAYDPGSFRARAGLAEALLGVGDLAAAEREASTARRLMPGDPRVLELLDKVREGQMDLP